MSETLDAIKTDNKQVRERLMQQTSDMIERSSTPEQLKKLNELNKHKQQTQKNKDKKIEQIMDVQLPQSNRTITEFSYDIIKLLSADEDLNLFYDPRINEIVEITTYFDKLQKRDITGIKIVDAKRLLTIIDERIQTFLWTKDKQGVWKKDYRSANEQIIKLVAVSTAFVDSLPILTRFLNYPMPFLDVNNNLITPKIKYDERFQAYTMEDTPQIQEISIERAKELLNEILIEFCFEKEIDKTIALAQIITPACRGLYNRATARTPLFINKANRERAGKDYLAGIPGILYEGRAIDDSPFVTGEKYGSGSEELRKKITSAIKQGRRRIHSSNNRGDLNNAVLEQFITSEVWRDRELGKNKELELSNEIDISLSANTGLTYTPDLWHRSRIINLFFAEEDPNSRIFKNPDLHGYIKKNRGLFLSAIYSLIKLWVEAEQPCGHTPFTSFPEWARVVGGIMCYHNLGDPCIKLEDDAIGGDYETTNMKEVWRIMSIYQTTHVNESFTSSDIKHVIVSKQDSGETDAFNGWDLLNDKKAQTKFGNLILRFIGREFKIVIGDYAYNAKLVIKESSVHKFRQTYEFKLLRC